MAINPSGRTAERGSELSSETDDFVELLGQLKKYTNEELMLFALRELLAGHGRRDSDRCLALWHELGKRAVARSGGAR